MAKKYVLVENCDWNEFHTEVNSFLADGYECQGGVCVVTFTYTYTEMYNEAENRISTTYYQHFVKEIT